MSDVFISHSSKDKEIADKVVKFLEDKGLTCWIAPRDIVPGSDWAASISTAITASKVFLIIYSVNSAASEQVAREVSLAESKQNVFVVPYKIDDTGLSGTFEYFLTGAHWISSNYSKKDYKLEELYTIVSGITGKNVQNITNNTYIDHLHIHNTDDLPGDIQKGVQEMSGQAKSPAPQNNAGSSKKKVRLIVIIAAVLIVGTGIAIAANSHKKSGDNPSSSSEAVSSAKLNDFKIIFCGWECTGTYEGEVNADNVPDGKGKYVGSYTNSSGYVHNVTIEGDFKSGSVTGNFDTVMEYAAEEDTKTWTQNGEFAQGLLNGKGKAESIYRSGDLKSSVQEGEFQNSVLVKGTLTKSFVDDTKVCAEGEWDEKGSFISGTITKYDKDGNVVETETADGSDSSSDAASSSVKLTDYKINFCGWDCTGTYEGEVNADNVPDGKGKYVGSYTNSSGYVHNVTIEGDFKSGSVTGNFDTVMEYAAEEDIKTWNQNGEFAQGKLNGKGKTEFIYRSGNISSSVQEGEFIDSVLRKGTITTIYVDGTKSVAEGEWDEKGSNISGTLTNYDKNGKVIEDNTSNTNNSSSDTSSLTLFTFASFLNASYDDVVAVMGEKYTYSDISNEYVVYMLSYQLKNLNFMGLDTIGCVTFHFDENNMVNGVVIGVGQNTSGSNTITSDKVFKQYADTAYSAIKSRYGDSTTAQSKADSDYIYEQWDNVNDSDYPNLGEILVYASSQTMGEDFYSVMITFAPKD